MLADVWTVRPTLLTVLHITYKTVAEACIEIHRKVVGAFITILRTFRLAHFTKLDSAGALQARCASFCLFEVVAILTYVTTILAIYGTVDAVVNVAF